MKWTDEKPTVPGWYWQRFGTSKNDPISIRHVFISDELYPGTPCFLMYMKICPVDIVQGQWAGPIPEPED